MTAPYRQSPSLLEALERHLGPMGFVSVPPEESLKALGVVQMYRRKNWNTNLGVAVATLGAQPLAQYVEQLRHEKCGSRSRERLLLRRAALGCGGRR